MGVAIPGPGPMCRTSAPAVRRTITPQLLASEVFDLTGLPDQVDGQSRAP